MAPVPKVRWRLQALSEPESRRLGAWRSAPTLVRTFGAATLAGDVELLARELISRDVWLASAGRVAIDALPPPPGRVTGIIAPARRRRPRKAARRVEPTPRPPRKRGLPALEVRRLPVVGEARCGDEAPPLTLVDLPDGVVPDWGTPVVEVAPPAPEPQPAADQRRVVRRVGLGAPLPAPPPRPVQAEVPPEASAPEGPVVVRAFPRRRLESVPDEVRRAVEAVTGVDLADVAVHRGAEVTHVARALRAKAYTVGGAVHLPVEHGPLSDPRARALLAHELVHVAQQRRLGDELPPEESPLGRLLELDALAVERTWLAPQLGGVQRRAEEDVLFAPPPSPQPDAAESFVESLEDDELEQLAARLYGPIRARLRRELLIDRERAALLTDVRR